MNSDDAEDRLFELMEIAECQQATVQTVPGWLAAEWAGAGPEV